MPYEMQMATIELQSSDTMKASYDSVPIANFCNDYIQKSTFPHLYDNEKRVLGMFGSTYCCEQLFSKMNYTKNKLLNRLSDCHLNYVLQVSSTNLPFDLKTLAVS